MNKLETVRPEHGANNTILGVGPFLAVVSQNHAKMTGRFSCEVRDRLERANESKTVSRLITVNGPESSVVC
jgi:hypothetical protein